MPGTGTFFERSGDFTGHDNKHGDRPLCSDATETAVRPTPDAECVRCRFADAFSRRADLERHGRKRRRCPRCDQFRDHVRDHGSGIALLVSKTMHGVMVGCGGAAAIVITNFNQALGEEMSAPALLSTLTY
jgi:hypothetical protein